jgi:GINS complex subunit 2
VRPFMVRVLQAFYKHDSPEMVQQADTSANKRPQVVDRGPRVSLCSFCYSCNFMHLYDCCH